MYHDYKAETNCATISSTCQTTMNDDTFQFVCNDQAVLFDRNDSDKVPALVTGVVFPNFWETLLSRTSQGEIPDCYLSIRTQTDTPGSEPVPERYYDTLGYAVQMAGLYGRIWQSSIHGQDTETVGEGTNAARKRKRDDQDSQPGQYRRAGVRSGMDQMPHVPPGMSSVPQHPVSQSGPDQSQLYPPVGVFGQDLTPMLWNSGSQPPVDPYSLNELGQTGYAHEAAASACSANLFENSFAPAPAVPFFAWTLGSGGEASRNYKGQWLFNERNDPLNASFHFSGVGGAEDMDHAMMQESWMLTNDIASMGYPSGSQTQLGTADGDWWRIGDSDEPRHSEADPGAALGADPTGI